MIQYRFIAFLFHLICSISDAAADQVHKNHEQIHLSFVATGGHVSPTPLAVVPHCTHNPPERTDTETDTWACASSTGTRLYASWSAKAYAAQSSPDIDTARGIYHSNAYYSVPPKAEKTVGGEVLNDMVATVSAQLRLAVPTDAHYFPTNICLRNGREDDCRRDTANEKFELYGIAFRNVAFEGIPRVGVIVCGQLQSGTHPFGANPPRLSLSDAMFYGFENSCSYQFNPKCEPIPNFVETTAVSYIIHTDITNEATQFVFEKAYGNMPSAEDISSNARIWTADSGNQAETDGFYALLGSPNDASTPRMLHDHFIALGRKRQLRIITQRPGDHQYLLIFVVGDGVVVPPALELNTTLNALLDL